MRQSKKLADRRSTSRQNIETIRRRDGRNVPVSQVRATADGAAAAALDARGTALGTAFVAAGGGSAVYTHGSGSIPSWVSIQATYNSIDWFQVVNGASGFSVGFNTSTVTVINSGGSGATVRAFALI